MTPHIIRTTKSRAKEPCERRWHPVLILEMSNGATWIMPDRNPIRRLCMWIAGLI